MELMIIGLGLIGGSLGLSFKDDSQISKIWGYDLDAESAQAALKMGAIDEITELGAGVARADVIFLCTPLNTYPALVEQIWPGVKVGAIVTDVGSTKRMAMELWEKLPEGVWAIGGHPMAGSEIAGIKGADRYLFENAAYILTPAPDVPAEIKSKLVALLKPTGAKVRFMTAAEHDAQVAVVSHLPHLAAAALVNLTGGQEDSLVMAGGGFRDTTRISASNPDLWEDILFSNREEVLRQLKQFIDILADLHLDLSNFNTAAINSHLAQAKKIREQIPRLQRTLVPVACDVVCIVPDRPGIIGELGRILGNDNVNIVDIEILRVREGDGGTIRIGVESVAAAKQAVAGLLRHNIRAWIR